MNRESSEIRWDESEAGECGLPFSTRFCDHFYSRHDGRAETRHVFLAGNMLPERWRDRQRFTIGELGFGTGLNFIETWRCWQQHRAPGQYLIFQSVEAYPMSADEAGRALSRWPELAELSRALITRWDHEGPFAVDGQTELHRHIGFAADEIGRFDRADAWFLDGFAPDRNPDMWSAELMKAVAEKTVTGGTFASYTAAGWVRRNLCQAGFMVTKQPGFGTKRDMIAGSKP